MQTQARTAQHGRALGGQLDGTAPGWWSAKPLGAATPEICHIDSLIGHLEHIEQCKCTGGGGNLCGR
jgi:hypothetical protein